MTALRSGLVILGIRLKIKAAMQIKRAIALACGLVILAIVTVLGILAANRTSLLTIAGLGIAAAILTPSGLELCRFAFRSGIQEYRLFSRGLGGYIFDLLSMLLAIFLMVATINFQHTSELLCDGRLSAGFPFAFICDASGESPLSSVGKIDWADLDSLNLVGSYLDILFYLALVWIARRAMNSLLQRAGRRTKYQ
jgi:hypothetical protein